MIDAETRAMAGMGVAMAMVAAPKPFLRVFGIPAADVTGTAEFGWRLFAVRNAWVTALALRGDKTAQSAFLPIQLMDQAVFWHAFARRSVPRRAPVLAATVSGAIIALDLRRRSRS